MVGPARSPAPTVRRERSPGGFAVIWTALVFAVAIPAFAAETEVAVRDVAGKERTGSVSALDANRLSLKTSAGRELAIPMNQILRIDRPAATAVRAKAAAFVYLANGDRIAATAIKIDGDDLLVVWTGLPKKPAMKFPLASVRAILLRRPASRDAFRKLENSLLQHRQQHDLVVLRNGDLVTGRLKSLDESNVVMSGSTGKIPRANVRAIAFDPRYVDKPKTPANRLLVRLADGTLVSAKAVELKGKLLTVKLEIGGEIPVPWSSVVSLQRIGGDVLPLSAIRPTIFEHTPYIDGKRPLRTDRNVLGGPLVLRGREYAIGLGMHSRSRVVYAIPPNARTFLATIGIDDAARGNGAAVFIVRLDGKPVFTSPVLMGTTAAVQVGPISLTGHKRLTLLVDFGPHGDVLDYADWCDAVIVIHPFSRDSKALRRGARRGITNDKNQMTDR